MGQVLDVAGGTSVTPLIALIGLPALYTLCKWHYFFFLFLGVFRFLAFLTCLGITISLDLGLERVSDLGMGPVPGAAHHHLGEPPAHLEALQGPVPNLGEREPLPTQGVEALVEDFL